VKSNYLLSYQDVPYVDVVRVHAVGDRYVANYGGVSAVVKEGEGLSRDYVIRAAARALARFYKREHRRQGWQCEDHKVKLVGYSEDSEEGLYFVAFRVS